MKKSYLAKYAKYAPLLLMLFFFNNIYGQIGKGQIWQCNTMESGLKISSSTTLATVAVVFDTTPKIINVFVHVINRDNGTGGLTNAQIDNWLSLFCSDYLAHNISIRVIGRANLNNTTFFNGMTNANYSNLITTDTHNDAIDIYLLSPADTYARASGIPGIALAVGGSYQGTSVLSHEFGHCLGLFHTHSGRGCDDYTNCAENINESNCSTCGDLICDTPADPCLSGNVNANCEYTGSSDFHPDVRNIMSYAPPTCLNRLTTGQVERIHSTIMNSSILLARSFDPYISGPSIVCSSGATFSINNLPTEDTIIWNQSYNLLTRVSPQGSNPCTFTANNSNNEGIIGAQIIVCGGTITLPDMQVRTGINNGDFSFEVWNSNGQLVDTQYGLDILCPNRTYNIYVINNGDCETTNYTWQIPSWWTQLDASENWIKIITNSDPSGSVSANAITCCGDQTQLITGDFWQASYCYNLSFTPNPATDETTLELLDASGIQADMAWDVEVYDQLQILKLKTDKAKKSNFKINTSSWKDGVYIVRVNIGKEIISGKLVVKH